jgi:hypothetical protein
MLLSKFLNIRNFYIFWGIIGVLLALAWSAILLEPKRTATSVGMTRPGRPASLGEPQRGLVESNGSACAA